jgi:hypothetical protein
MAKKSNSSGGEGKPAPASRPRRSSSTALPGPVETSVPIAISEAADMSMPIVASSLHDATAVQYEDVARRAYEKYAEQGFVDGHDIDHWLAAEQELRGQRR